jgi:hypothetical protein
LVSVVSLLVILFISVFVTRVATVALVMTGLSRESASFQARSAFTGVGFTTDESEDAVNHPARRRVLMLLMLLGNAGFVTAVSSLLLSFVGPDGEKTGLLTRILVLAGGVAAIVVVSYSRIVDRLLSPVFHRLLSSWTGLPARDRAHLLHLSEGYGVAELAVREGDWLAGKRLREAHLREEGVLVLGIQRGETEYFGAPEGDAEILAGDLLIVYGPSERLQALDERTSGRAGDREHGREVQRSEREREESRKRERESRERERRRQEERKGKASAD